MKTVICSLTQESKNRVVLESVIYIFCCYFSTVVLQIQGFNLVSKKKNTHTQKNQNKETGKN